MNEAICLAKLYDELPDELVGRVIRRAAGLAQVFPVKAHSANDYLNGIANWYQQSSNCQYLVSVSHGLLGNGTCYGIGCGTGTHQQILWDTLWDRLVMRKNKPPALLFVGCETAEAARHLSQRLTDRFNNPYIIGLTNQVHGAGDVRRVYRVVETLVHSVTQMNISLTPESELISLRAVWPQAKLFYPVKFPGRSKPQFVDHDGFSNTVGQSFVQYLTSQSARFGAIAARRRRN